jgi:hypothetical protein
MLQSYAWHKICTFTLAFTVVATKTYKDVPDLQHIHHLGVLSFLVHRDEFPTLPLGCADVHPFLPLRVYFQFHKFLPSPLAVLTSILSTLWGHTFNFTSSYPPPWLC